MKKILVVDDNPDILYVVQVMLESVGYEVTALSQISATAGEVGRHFPDLILLDMMLAGMDGREVCRALKAHPQFRSIPIILFSASDIMPGEVLTCGANDYIAKPFDMDDMLLKIDSLLNTQKI